MTAAARSLVRTLIDRAVRQRQIDGRECLCCLGELPAGRIRYCTDTCRKRHHAQARVAA